MVKISARASSGSLERKHLNTIPSDFIDTLSGHKYARRKITNKNSFLLRGKDTTLINQALASYTTKQKKDSSSWITKIQQLVLLLRGQYLSRHLENPLIN